MSKRNPMPEGRWEQAMQEAGHRCQATAWGLTTPCDGRLVVHHRQTRGMGGTRDPAIHDLSNLLVLCGGPTGRDGHHGEVHDNPRRSYELGLMVRR